MIRRRGSAPVPALTLALGLAALAALAGCTASAAPPDGSTAIAHGSWADEMAQERAKATSPDVRDALADGEISDQEYAETKDRYLRCLSAAGITVTRYDVDGVAYTPPSSMSTKQAHEREASCSISSGEYPIAFFYLQMRINPSNGDLGQAIVDCYKREKLVGPDYDLGDYHGGDLPSGDSAKACDRDPEGRLGG